MPVPQQDARAPMLLEGFSRVYVTVRRGLETIPSGFTIELMSERILLVDDSLEALRLVSVFLRRAGYEIVAHTSGEEALALLERPEESFALIVLDLNMPGLNGHEVCTRLKRIPGRDLVPVIFLSGTTETEDKVRALEAGAADFVNKTSNLAELVARIRTQIKLSRLTQDLSRANADLRAKQRILDADLRSAATVQQCLLPQALIESEHCNLVWRFFPCDAVAGDLLNVFQPEDDRLSWYLLDVSGHGASAALVAACAAQTLAPGFLDGEAHESIIGPSAILEALDRQFPIERFERFFTIVYMTMDLKSGLVTFANAGHPLPLLINPDGEVLQLPERGFAIGIDDGARASTSLHLERGAKLVLVSDGVTECGNGTGRLFGAERLRRALEHGAKLSCDELADHIHAELCEFSGHDAFVDDVSYIIVEYR